ncbi:MAG TPA: hypothetical protein VES02_08810 [Dermatophilaceae bacterium]|nr:hypothetical protein [Dermatophilaceae bacterium]
MGAATDSEILGYQALQRGDLGYGVLDFRQTLTVAGAVATFDCIATLIWKRSSTGWVEFLAVRLVGDFLRGSRVPSSRHRRGEQRGRRLGRIGYYLTATPGPRVFA